MRVGEVDDLRIGRGVVEYVALRGGEGWRGAGERTELVVDLADLEDLATEEALEAFEEVLRRGGCSMVVTLAGSSRLRVGESACVCGGD